MIGHHNGTGNITGNLTVVVFTYDDVTMLNYWYRHCKWVLKLSGERRKYHCWWTLILQVTPDIGGRNIHWCCCYIYWCIGDL